MNRRIVLLTAILVVSNIVWALLFYNSQSDRKHAPDEHHPFQIYFLDGRGVTWDITDYKIIIAHDHILRGEATLVYKGNPEEIEDSSYFEYTFYEMDSDGTAQAVYVNETIAIGGTVSILHNLDTGSQTSSYLYDELAKDKQTYESTYAEIRWKDSGGKLHTETVQLDIRDEIMME